MVDPLEAVVPLRGSRHLKCCIEDDEDYKVTFQMDSWFFPAGKKPTAELLGHILSCIQSEKSCS